MIDSQNDPDDSTPSLIELIEFENELDIRDHGTSPLPSEFQWKRIDSQLKFRYTQE